MPTPVPAPTHLTPADAERYASIRKEMLLDAPWAFLSAPGEDVGSDPIQFAERLAQPENEVLAIEEGALLVSVAGVVRSTRTKTRHRASIWGVYTRPNHRGRGFARAVMLAAIATARRWPGVSAIGLSVSSNASAAIALYQSLGFAPWGAEPDAIRIGDQSFSEVHMLLRL